MEAHETLTALGLNQYETKAYLALVRRESATPAEVAELSGVPRQRAYDVLQSLAEQSLVAAVGTAPLRYTALRPDTAISALVDRRRQEQLALEQSSETLRMTLAAVWSQGRSHEAPLRYVEVLRDRNAVGARLTKMIEEVRESYLVLVRPPFYAPMPESDDDLKNAHLVRSIYERSVLDNAAVTDFLRRSVTAGEQVHIAGALPLKMAIADHRFVAVHLPDPVASETPYTVLVVDHPDLAEVLELAFEALWVSSEPLDSV